MSEELVVTDCCGRLLPKGQTLTGDVHFPDLCVACIQIADSADEGLPHERHISCIGECPGRDWTYVRQG